MSADFCQTPIKSNGVQRKSDHLVTIRTGAVLEVRLNRPEKKNALTRAMYNGMADAFDTADRDPEIRAVLLTGTGDTFTSGNDIKDFQARAAQGTEGAGSRFLPTISTMQTPLIGRSKKTRKSPRDISSVRRKFSSNGMPRMNPSSSGTGSKRNSFMPKPSRPMPHSIHRSKTLLLVL